MTESNYMKYRGKCKEMAEQSSVTGKTSHETLPNGKGDVT